MLHLNFLMTQHIADIEHCKTGSYYIHAFFYLWFLNSDFSPNFMCISILCLSLMCMSGAHRGQRKYRNWSYRYLWAYQEPCWKGLRRASGCPGGSQPLLYNWWAGAPWRGLDPRDSDPRLLLTAECLSLCTITLFLTYLPIVPRVFTLCWADCL